MAGSGMVSERVVGLRVWVWQLPTSVGVGGEGRVMSGATEMTDQNGRNLHFHHETTANVHIRSQIHTHLSTPP